MDAWPPPTADQGAAEPPADAGAEAEAAAPPPPPTQVLVERPPTALAMVEATTDAVAVQWAPVACTVVGPDPSVAPPLLELAVHYELQMQQVDSKAGLHPERWSVQYAGGASFVHVRGLRPGRTYAARVTALPVVAATPPPGLELVLAPSQPSDTLLVHTLPCPPMGQPAPTLASRTKRELKFKWAEPEETGGRALEYELEMSPAPEGWEGAPTPEGYFPVYRGPERAHLAKRLTPGVQYCARVKAANCEGESAWSPLAVFYTQATVPSWAPCDAPFVWDAAPATVSLGWPEPASNGGNVTGYEVEMDDGAGFRHAARTAERQCTVEGLRSGVLYKFRVRAENEAGRSLWSPVGEGRTAAVVPGPCSAPSALGSSHTSLSIRWEAPEDDGGSPVCRYLVELRPRSRAAQRTTVDEWVVAYEGNEPACTIQHLQPGCSYMARAAAVSKVGRGDFGAAAILQTSPSTPECPAALAVTARQQTELTVAWALPEHDGGAPISAYRLEMSCLGARDSSGGGAGGKGKGKLDPPFELAHLGPELGAVVGGLEPGHRYSFRCRAINAQGSSEWGPLLPAETLPGLPFPVDSLALAAAAATSVKLRWDAPYGRGAPVTSYVAEVADAAALDAAQQHAAAAAARQRAQDDAAAAAAAPTEAAAPAGAAAPAAAPAGEGAEGCSSDAVAAALDRLFRPAYQGPECSCTVAGLEPHTEYAFRVHARNAVGSSVSEVERARTAPAPPSCPRGLRLQGATPTGLQLSWQAPLADRGAAVSGYQLECASVRGASAAAAGAWRAAYQGGDLHAQVGSLEAGSRYLVRARACNACGWGQWCEPLPCATAPDVPTAPGGLAAKAVGTAVRVAWEAADDGGAPVERYELQVAGGRGGGAWAPAYLGDATAHRLAQLDADATYSLRVRAVNAVGPGPYSPAVEVRTSKAPPSAPTDVQARAAGAGAIEVSWAAAAQGAQQAVAVSYEVEAVPEADRRAAPVRQPCPGRACSAHVAVPRGGAYRVRVRAVGADGAGHGDWSEAATVAVEGPEPAAAAAAAGGGEPAGKLHKRRGEGAKADRQQQQQQQQPRAVAAAKTSTAKGPPKRGWWARAERLGRRGGLTPNQTAMVVAVLVIGGPLLAVLLALMS